MVTPAAAATTFLGAMRSLGAYRSDARAVSFLERSTQLAFVKALGQLKKIFLHTYILVRQRTVSWNKTEKSSAPRLIRAAAPRAAHEDNIMRR